MLFKQRKRSLSIFTPAKLNLFLEIHGRRADGFHELETLMVSVGIYDTLTFTEGKTGEIELQCFDAESLRRKQPDQAAELPAHDDNLVVRAANLLRNFVKTKRGVKVDLVKRIPVASGLAGGSSDAAATLAGLNRYWKLGLTSSQLIQLGGQLGSDVSFFLAREPIAVCRGRGEIVEPVSLPMNLWFVIVRPGTGLSTPAVFRECRPSKRPKCVKPLLKNLREGRRDRLGKAMYNALQEPAETLNSEIAELRKRFSTLPFSAHLMTGSGTAYFGVCASRRHARRMASRLKRMHLGSVYVAESGP